MIKMCYIGIQALCYKSWPAEIWS